MTRSSDRKPFAKKSLGQNFLSDPNYIRKIVDALSLEPGDRVVEIGPGRGALTGALLERGAEVTAVELDRDLIPLLHSEFDSTGRFRLVEGDALKLDFREVCGSEAVKLAANLPYYISTAILQHLIEQRSCFTQLVLMLQKEVVDRITAGPGDGERGFLSVMVEAVFSAEKLFDVPPTAFRPAPKVWSSVVNLTPKTSLPEHASLEALRTLVSAGFAQRRKTILNNLKSARIFAGPKSPEEALAEAAVDSSRRAETLSLEEWWALAGTRC